MRGIVMLRIVFGSRVVVRSVLAGVVAIVMGADGATAADNSMRPTNDAPSAPSTQPANDARMGTFMLPGIEFKFPLPAGFCLPTGRYDDRARLTAGADTANITDISFDDCADMASGADLSRWGMVKTPRVYASADAGTREKFLRDLKAEIASGDFQKSMEQGVDDSNEALQQMYGPGAHVGAHMVPLETDANAGYIGGTITVNGEHGPVTLACVWSVTVIKHRVLLLYFYGPYTAPNDIQALLNIRKPATAKMIDANEAF